MNISRDILSAIQNINNKQTIYEQSHLYYNYKISIDTTSEKNRIVATIGKDTTARVITYNMLNGNSYFVIISSTADKVIYNDTGIYSVYYGAIDEEHKIPNLYVYKDISNNYMFIELNDIDNITLHQTLLGIVPIKKQLTLSIMDR